MSETNVNHSMPNRRTARDQEQKLDHAATAVQALMSPYLQMWAIGLTLLGDSYIAWGGMIDRWSGNHN